MAYFYLSILAEAEPGLRVDIAIKEAKKLTGNGPVWLRFNDQFIEIKSDSDPKTLYREYMSKFGGRSP